MIIPKIKPLLISGLVLIIFILFILVGVFYWFTQLQPSSRVPTKKTFVIQKGESITSIAEKLAAENLIKNPLFFKVYVKLNNLSNKIQAGSYLLDTSWTMESIAQNLTKGTFDVWVTIPEGLRKAEIAGILKGKLEIDDQQFITIAKEGYLFPDTYLIPKNYTAKDIIHLMEKNWQIKIKPINRSLTNEELTLASIIEREAIHDEDRLLIAGILKKRHDNGWALEADATVQYALGYIPEEKSWWKKKINQDDLQIDSPFNTRKYTDYPPGPICNPGIKAITAAISPQNSPYWYYLSDNDGNMHYAKTLDEHNLNIHKYL